MPPQGLDLLIDPFDLAGRYINSCMCYDPLKVGIKQLAKPEEVFVPVRFTYVHDVCYCFGHPDFVSHGVSQRQFLLDQIKGKKEFILLEQSIIFSFISGLAL